MLYPKAKSIDQRRALMEQQDKRLEAGRPDDTLRTDEARYCACRCTTERLVRQHAAATDIRGSGSIAATVWAQHGNHGRWDELVAIWCSLGKRIKMKGTKKW